MARIIREELDPESVDRVLSRLLAEEPSRTAQAVEG